jgi:hypothetical protein
MNEINDLITASEGLARQVSTELESSLQAALTRLLGDAHAVDQALAEGSCDVDGSTLAWRVDEQTLMLELYCDIGLPEPAQEHEAYRRMLEINLCRSCPGLYVGLHPESRRLVAATLQPAVLLVDENFCVAAMENLVGQARVLREAAGL